MKNYNNAIPDFVYDIIAVSKTFKLSLFDKDIVRFNKLIDFIGNNLEYSINYYVFLSYNYKRFRFSANRLFVASNKFIINDVHDCEKITEFYSKLMAYLNKIDAISHIKNIEIYFYRS